MITKNDKIRCDICGKFISYEDLQRNNAVNKMVTPDSNVSFEEYESYHKDCLIQANIKYLNKTTRCL